MEYHELQHANAAEVHCNKDHLPSFDSYSIKQSILCVLTPSLALGVCYVEKKN